VWDGVVILQKKVAGVSEASLDRFLLRAKGVVGLRGGVNVMVTSSAEMRSLNSRFRGLNQATDVLSFPSPLQVGGKKRLAGEIAICAEIAARNAVLFGHSPALEIKVLALHGLLHLAGMDHERDNGQMARKEAHLRQRLHLPSTLTERARQRISAAGRSRRKSGRKA
jgi:probable rRNA maturation factor